MAPNRKVLVGLFVLAGFFLFALGLFWIGDRRLLFSDSMELRTEFANLSGLKIGSKVMVSGMDAGEVLTIQVPPRPGAKFVVLFRVLERFHPILRTDSVASIQVEGLVGSKILQVEAGTEGAAQVASGATIPSREPVEISEVVQQAVDMMKKLDVAVDDVQGRVVKTVDTLTALGEEAREVVGEVGDSATSLFSTGKKIAQDVDYIVDNVRNGRGTVGKLFNDERLYERARNTLQHVEGITANTNTMSEDVRKMVADLQSRNLGEKLEKTATNIQQATARVNDVMLALKPSGSAQQGLLASMQDTLDNTREATGDLAENMEALKRNWLFRGFFRNRGFFDVDSISLEDYRQGKIAPERPRERFWLHAYELFTTSEAGEEVLSEEGRKQIAANMVPYLRYIPNTLIVVEGYAGEGSEDEQFLRSRDRARMVREHLIRRFGVKPNHIAVVPMGAVRSSAPGGDLWNGVSVVAFPEENEQKVSAR